MPRHVWMMWLLAGGGTLVGASLMYLATRPVLLPATTRVQTGWRRVRDTIPTIFKSKSVGSTTGGPASSVDWRTRRAVMQPSGSSAFDEYRAAQISALEHEANEFREFLKRLRDARDREEFDDFLRDKKAGHTKTPITIDNE